MSVASSGFARTTTYDVFNTQPFSERWVEFDPGGRRVGDISQYDTANGWLANHNLGSSHVNLLTPEAAEHFIAEVGRVSFHGTGFDAGMPSMLSYKSYFGPGYDFNLGNFDIDTGYIDTVAYTDISLTGGDASYDFSGYQGIEYIDLDFSYLNGGGGFGGWNYFDDWGTGGGDWWYPVILDLDNDGIDITPRQDSTVYFNVDGDAAKEQTAWVGAGDGLLVIDLAAGGGSGPDGIIDQANEIAFARWTSDPDDTDLDALATVFDTSQDGRLDASDARWGEFRVWKDNNQNGVTDASELLALSTLGITSISLASDRRASEADAGCVAIPPSTQLLMFAA